MDETNASVVTARDYQIPGCLSILMDSILGKYFGPDLARKLLTEGCHRGELVAVEENGQVLGFYVLANQATFLVFPYLHLLAVKTDHRSRGIGTTLLAHLEKSVLETPGYPFRPKIFLLVAEENARAIRFYERCGYSKQAVFDDMFDEGDTELLFMKDLGPKNLPDPQSGGN